eukprot:COSAG01_NODE_47198_length_392_cov_4.767918_1_plen_36_part_10
MAAAAVAVAGRTGAALQGLCREGLGDILRAPPRTQL